MLWLLACPEPSTTALPERDYERFVEEVQPVLGPRCSNPACHGDPGRPLELYEPGWHRAEAGERWLDAPLSQDELEANFDRSRAFLARPADRSPLLTEPLAVDAGGVDHPVTVYLDTAEPEYRVVLGWAEGAPP